MDSAARAALARLVRCEARTELAPEFDLLAERVRDLQRQLDALAGRTGGPVRPHARDQEIARLHGLGFSTRLIADAVGVHRATVTTVVRRLPQPPLVRGRDGRATRPRRKAAAVPANGNGTAPATNGGLPGTVG